MGKIYVYQDFAQCNSCPLERGFNLIAWHQDLQTVTSMDSNSKIFCYMYIKLTKKCLCLHRLFKVNSLRSFLVPINYHKFRISMFLFSLLFLSGYIEKYWTGCYRDGPGSTWAWRDGSSVNKTAVFRPNEPSGSGDCAYWHLYDDGLNDFPCSDWPNAKILCEIDIV